MELYKYAVVEADKIKPYANNARTHSAEQIAQLQASIKSFGFTNPLLIDENFNLIAGHGRLEAGKGVGMTQFPAIICDGLSETDRRALILADNKLALNAGWDEDKLRAEIKELKDLKFDTDVLGFSTKELDDLFMVPKSGKTEDDEVPPVAPPISQATDVWILGNHRVMCGDSTSLEDVRQLMDGQLADLLATDPPYNVAYEGKTKEAMTIQNDSMGDGEFRLFLAAAFRAAEDVLRPGAGFYIWHADSEGYNFRGALRDVGLRVRQCLIWVKDTMVMGRQDYHWKHEPCLYGWKEGAAHAWESDRKQTTLLECKRPTKSTLHPTMKPVELIEGHLVNSTKPKALVLDLFGGSGSTLIACEKLTRSCRMMELDAKYVDVIVRRWEAYTGQEAVLETTKETFATVSRNRQGSAKDQP